MEKRTLEPCPHCLKAYFHDLAERCPWCGKPHQTPSVDSGIVQMVPKRDWGGKRAGAGAPRANLNRLIHGRQSKLLKLAVEKLAADPELRAFLLLLARAATEGELPQTTKYLITRALGDRPVRRLSASLALRKLRGEQQ